MMSVIDYIKLGSSMKDTMKDTMKLFNLYSAQCIRKSLYLIL